MRVAIRDIAADKGGTSSGTVATVNGQAISQNTYNAFVAEQKAQGAPDSPELQNAVKEELVRRELLTQEAKKKGLDKKPEIQGQMELAKQAVLIRAFLTDYVKANPISEAQLKAEYDVIKNNLGSTEYKSRHVLVEKEEDAKAIIADLGKGADFAKIAKEVGAIFWVDMAHYAGLIAAGFYPNPVPFADVITSTTHKTLRGPRGGIILMKAEHEKARVDAANLANALLEFPIRAQHHAPEVVEPRVRIVSAFMPTLRAGLQRLVVAFLGLLVHAFDADVSAHFVVEAVQQHERQQPRHAAIAVRERMDAQEIQDCERHDDQGVQTRHLHGGGVVCCKLLHRHRRQVCRCRLESHA